MKSLLHTDWDNVEELIENTLNDHMRAYDYYDYFIINDSTVLVKVYEKDRLMFSVKMRLQSDKLEVVEVN
ncbi:hypothetical protein EWF20_03265 [Sulfolobus sp. S-194]|uniref:hypothetical protein n=1 Tax=Sulfolobus sp. S-194 TaxID=2512240 RepID=UPI001436DACF|nr:hypothetical protein [Sulfolobus sp. S-194]QIW23257.1 hypothetical protein EWF20_03265 [Sulfolobus sp. S-194]